MDLGLSGKTFIVGGGSAGLGFASARALVGEGARVVIAARRPDRLADALAALGADAAGLAVDVADPSVPDALVALAQERFGRLDGAVVNTGGPRSATVRDLTEQDWQDGAQALLIGPARLADTVVRHLAAHDGGAVVGILSTSVKNPIPQLALSNIYRPALAAHLKDLADAYGAGASPVRVNGVLPYRVETERSRGGAAPESALGRFGRPEEFGAAIAFLLSPAAGYITGAAIPLDGGRLRSL
ncbi:SDR family oxidoreductase [Microbacterium ulmi]|uniref:SDR family oxidoreductase n=1 Tax=Microbacterium ulmi TaxID=179095 RepID=A0A7Y2M140_9MICO|nr:SDR family oxidoreductase [Microbacterium ulmi]NII69302.1 3-oxoacyl-[acyl-carrier protein] reductase [Microbacterium ulmi]NNH04084.1 SDR family oxidoreductase [Microbacterium ulmi]